MKVFKFGGASVNSADAVRNMSHIVGQRLDKVPLWVVVSAMGKTTNRLEQLVPTADRPIQHELIESLAEYHIEIANSLIPSNKEATNKVVALFDELEEIIQKLHPSPEEYNFNYDQIVSFGEIISTTIIAEYLNSQGIKTLLLDARQLIRTDSRYREGQVDWATTKNQIAKALSDNGDYDVMLTQGFIAGNSEGYTTTLGREGSDYSASIIAHSIDAESMTIWKDVPGFLNADPKYFTNTIKISEIPYNEAIELAYYGASVIHPKTVKPLQNKNIPLFVNSFITPETEGSIIGNYHSIKPETPLYIFKNNQILLSILPRDFSFIAEENLKIIFGILSELGIKVNLMQNSALSFSLCIDNTQPNVKLLLERLTNMFHVRYNENLQLITIRYYTQEVIDSIVQGRTILLDQRSRLTTQLIVNNTR